MSKGKENPFEKDTHVGMKRELHAYMCLPWPVHHHVPHNLQNIVAPRYLNDEIATRSV
jgi:hypothetical protein